MISGDWPTEIAVYEVVEGSSFLFLSAGLSHVEWIFSLRMEQTKRQAPYPRGQALEESGVIFYSLNQTVKKIKIKIKLVKKKKMRGLSLRPNHPSLCSDKYKRESKIGC